jgi:arylsulfatase A-like enzyme
MTARLSHFAVLVFAWSAVGVGAATPPPRPNVLVILTDDQGWGDTQAQGAPDLRTPHLDELFRAGLVFENFYANSPVCSPTRAALLSGRFPDRVGVPGVVRDETPADSWGRLAPDVTLLPAVLRETGYTTALVGKWHLGTDEPQLPNVRGFDRFHGFLGDMMDDYWTHLRRGINYLRSDGTVIEAEGHATAVFTRWACDYLEQQAGGEKPFFLLLAYTAPHTPIQPPPAALAHVLAREPGIDPARAKLVALIEDMDAGIGQVLATLERTGQAANTLVLFTSDNGGDVRWANNGAWRGGKGSVYEGGLRVPTAARWPGVVPPGSRTDRLAMTMDIYATLAELAGAPLAAEVDGRSFLPELRGEVRPAEIRDLYFVRREGRRNYGGKTIEALRRGDWKILQNTPYTPLELYNLADDPGETRDLARAYLPIFGEMADALRAHVRRGGSVPWDAPRARP